MSKHLHEIRDPIHVFVRLDSDERRVLDSRPFQRLRHIHQLALTYLLYPAATHKRFEHSLGVMELASRIFDVVTHEAHLTEFVRKTVPELTRPGHLDYWRRVLRMAALSHDLGHLPFSHAAEKELLPPGWDHERLTRDLILSPHMAPLWHAMTPPLRPLDVAKLAVGPRKAPDLTFSTWETILSEIVVGDAFGADRMDYLLRDSHHAGVAYGRFDHFRLIDTLRILPTGAGDSGPPALGVEEGGLPSAEALLLARYAMYSQVYFHPVRRIYDIHLQDFLAAWLPGGKFPTDLEAHLRLTDDKVCAALADAALDPAHSGHDPARRIATHDHFKALYRRRPDDLLVNRHAARAVFHAARACFGPDNVRFDSYRQRPETTLFPVRLPDGTVFPAARLSQVLLHLPLVAVDHVFIRPDLYDDGVRWLAQHRPHVIQTPTEN